MQSFPFIATGGPLLTHYRVYDPALGRWLSRDPIAEAGGINLYGYVGGNPVNLIDPLGLFAGVDDIIVGGGVLAVGCAVTPSCSCGMCGNSQL